VRPATGGQGLPRTVERLHGDPDLPQIIRTPPSSRRLSGRLDGRQQQPHERPDDGDHHQQFHECETAAPEKTTAPEDIDRAGIWDGRPDRMLRGGDRFMRRFRTGHSAPLQEQIIIEIWMPVASSPGVRFHSRSKVNVFA
jgi:hypothetical protein